MKDILKVHHNFLNGLDWSLLHLFVLKVSMEHVLIKLVKCNFGFTKFCGCKFSWNWIFTILCFCVQHYALLIHYCLYIYFQSVATFFSQVMSAIGGNTAGPGFCCFSLLFALCIWCHLMFKILVLAAVSSFGEANTYYSLVILNFICIGSYTHIWGSTPFDRIRLRRRWWWWCIGSCTPVLALVVGLGVGEWGKVGHTAWANSSLGTTGSRQGDVLSCSLNIVSSNFII